MSLAPKEDFMLWTVYRLHVTSLPLPGPRPWHSSLLCHLFMLGMGRPFRFFSSVPLLILATTPHTLLGLQYPLSRLHPQELFQKPGLLVWLPLLWAPVTPGFLYVPRLLGHCLLCHSLVTWPTQGSRHSYSLCVKLGQKCFVPVVSISLCFCSLLEYEFPNSLISTPHISSNFVCEIEMKMDFFFSYITAKRWTKSGLEFRVCPLSSDGTKLPEAQNHACLSSDECFTQFCRNWTVNREHPRTSLSALGKRLEVNLFSLHITFI